MLWQAYPSSPSEIFIIGLKGTGRITAAHADSRVESKSIISFVYDVSYLSMMALISFMYFSMYLLRAFWVFRADLGNWTPEFIISVSHLFCSV